MASRVRWHSGLVCHVQVVGGDRCPATSAGAALREKGHTDDLRRTPTASSIALAMAAGGPKPGGSATARAPNGPSSVGICTRTFSMAGISAAVLRRVLSLGARRMPTPGEAWPLVEALGRSKGHAPETPVQKCLLAFLSVQGLARGRRAGGRLLCYNSHHNTVLITSYGTSSSDREVRMILTTPSGNLAAT